METKGKFLRELLLKTIVAAFSLILISCGDDDGDDPDPIPPSNVTDFEAIAGNGEVSLSWSAVLDFDLTGYEITYTPDGSTPIVLGETVTSRTVTGLTNGTLYTFSIVAVNESGLRSTTPATTTVAPLENPPIVPGAFAIDYPDQFPEWRVYEDSTHIFRASSTSDDVAISWSASENAVSYSLLGKYVIDTAETFLAEWEVIKENITTTSVTVNHNEVEMPGVIYSFMIQAVSVDEITTDSNDNPDMNEASSGRHYFLTRGRPADPVTIGGEVYETVQIGDVVWTARNLNADAAPINGVEHDFLHMSYDLGDDNSKANSGRLYALAAAQQIADQVAGFSVPEEIDFFQLYSFLGFSSDDPIAPSNQERQERGANTIFGTVAKSSTGWWNDHEQITTDVDQCCGGDDYLGLSFFPGGIAELIYWDGCCYFGWPMYLNQTLDEQGRFYGNIINGWDGAAASDTDADPLGKELFGVRRDLGSAYGDNTDDPTSPSYGAGSYMGSVRLVRYVQ